MLHNICKHPRQGLVWQMRHTNGLYKQTHKQKEMQKEKEIVDMVTLGRSLQCQYIITNKLINFQKWESLQNRGVYTGDGILIVFIAAIT